VKYISFEEHSLVLKPYLKILNSALKHKKSKVHVKINNPVDKADFRTKSNTELDNLNQSIPFWLILRNRKLT